MMEGHFDLRCGLTGKPGRLVLLAAILAWLTGCARETAPEPIREWGQVEDFEQPLAVFEHVFWEPRDTTTTREFLRAEDLTGKRVMEIGTGSGLLSLCALQAGAAQVVATDVNPHAVANARYNAERLGLAARFDVRQVAEDAREAFVALRPGETFDLIVSNPPWEDANVGKIEDYALYDPGWLLLESLLDGLPERLAPDGRLWLAYGTRSGVLAVIRAANARGFPVTMLEQDQEVAALPNEFLPAVTLEIRLP
ncbi:MAG: class I SAM-dependent methyltransferase [Acidobacteria bacterium]|nr:class I SAM-dependent methyltransferase [Acidobacteriota bacterium]